MNLFVIGSSITSAYWNGAATYYRGIYKALHALGHDITFAEPDAYNRQSHRDGTDADFPYVRSWVYRTPEDLARLLEMAAGADLVIKHSGVGVDDAFLEAEVVRLKSSGTAVAFWDVDAPATLARVEGDTADPFRACIPQYDFIFTYGGGETVAKHYRALGAKHCQPIYNAHDPETHYPEPPRKEFLCDLVFVGNRLPDRERRVEEFFLKSAELAPEMSFVLGGEGWGGKAMPGNVSWIGHVATADHNAVNSSARMVLNINRVSMAETGFSPPTRVFEAAAAGACVVTDEWAGIEQFFTPGEEILVARNGEEVAEQLRRLSSEELRTIGEKARARCLADHTYAQRAEQVQQALRQALKQAA